MTDARPRRLVVVAGTDTEVGKTFVSALLIAELRADGWTVEARKPVQSTSPGEPTDAEILSGASGEPVDTVCPPARTYAVPLAPPMAAEAVGGELSSTAQMCSELASSWGPIAADVGIVELAGGMCSPMSTDGGGRDVIVGVAPDLVVLVADAGLGTINHVRSSIGALEMSANTAGVRSPQICVVLNRYDDGADVHRRNLKWLREVDRLQVVFETSDLATTIVDLVDRHCGFCGRSRGECDGGCVKPLDPDHFCEKCGRRMIVKVTPTNHSARCKVHGTQAI